MTTRTRMTTSPTLRKRILSEYGSSRSGAITDPSSISEPPPEWARSASLENYAMTLGQSAPQSADDAGTQRYRVAAAAKTTRLEINE